MLLGCRRPAGVESVSRASEPTGLGPLNLKGVDKSSTKSPTIWGL